MINIIRKLLSLDHISVVSPNTIVVVSGLPRTGTSMMMKMLNAGGMDIVVDRVREADSDNPEGYYEDERVKQLVDGDVDWMTEAQGKGVKVIVSLLKHLPLGYTYKIIFMNRAIPEILASQRKMLIRRGEDPDRVPDEEMKNILKEHVKQVKAWLNTQAHFQILDIDYKKVLTDRDTQIHKINTFVGGFLDEQDMFDVINPNLYRNRGNELSVGD